MGAGRFRVPILMYHNVSDDPQIGIAPSRRTAIDPFTFRQQMRFLLTAGYHTARLSEVAAWLGDGCAPPQKTVVITFDGGLRSSYTHAFPLLQEFSFSATVFLPTAFIGASRRSFNKMECLTWLEVREMHKAGIQFGSHTVSHPLLHQLPRVELMRELAVSKAEIERQLGEPAATLSYPYEFPRGNTAFAADFRDLVVKAGYVCCVTSELGRVKSNDDPYRLKRLPVNALDDPALFRAKLEGGYDWQAWAQRVFHRFGSRGRPAPDNTPSSQAR